MNLASTSPPLICSVHFFCSHKSVTLFTQQAPEPEPAEREEPEEPADGGSSPSGGPCSSSGGPSDPDQRADPAPAAPQSCSTPPPADERMTFSLFFLINVVKPPLRPPGLHHPGGGGGTLGQNQPEAPPGLYFHSAAVKLQNPTLSFSLLARRSTMSRFRCGASS